MSCQMEMCSAGLKLSVQQTHPGTQYAEAWGGVREETGTQVTRTQGAPDRAPDTQEKKGLGVNAHVNIYCKSQNCNEAPIWGGEYT